LRTKHTMSGAEQSDVYESLISMLKENKKRVDILSNKIEENSDVFRQLFGLLVESEKRLDALERKLAVIEEKHILVDERKSTPDVMAPARTILVVDDDKKLTTSFKLILENAGYVVEVANTGFKAHILVTKNFYDLVLLDWHLRDAFGDQIADTIEKKHNGTKIIFIIGYEYIIDAYDRENQILMKPIDPDFLLETVANVFPNEQNLHKRAQIHKYKKEHGIEQDPIPVPAQDISDV